jgi:hypothetical protein
VFDILRASVRAAFGGIMRTIRTMLREAFRPAPLFPFRRAA